MINNPGLPMQTPAQSLGQMSPQNFMPTWDQGMISNILQKNPGLRRVIPDGGLQTFNAPPDREKNPIHEGRFSEWYQKGEPGGGDMLPNPGNLNNYNLEYYKSATPDVMTSPQIRQAETMGEMLHAMPNDQLWATLKNHFMSQFSPAAQAYYKDMSPEEFRNNIADAFLRASFFQNPEPGTTGLHPPSYSPPGDYFNNQEWINHYSPAQQQTIGQMKDLLQTGTVHYIPEDY